MSDKFRFRRKGEITLDYIGKFMLLIIAILIAIGIIITISDKIKRDASNLLPDEGEPIFVRIDSPNKDVQIGKIINLIDICFATMKDKIDSKTCYIVRNELSPFSITSSEIEGKIVGSLKDVVVFDSTVYDRDTIVIGYVGVERKVHVER